jgi:hypothetical protein
MSKNGTAQTEVVSANPDLGSQAQKRTAIPQQDCMVVTINVAIPIDVMNPDTLTEGRALIEKAKAALAGAHVEVDGKLGKRPSTLFKSN